MSTRHRRRAVLAAEDTRMLLKARPDQSRVRNLVEAPLARLRVEELDLLRFLSPRHEGTSLAQLHRHDPAAQSVVDRLVSRGEVTRYPGCLFGVSTSGRHRLAHST